MSKFKNLISRATEGLPIQKSSNKHFGLEHFIKASTDQMLMTRGGYGQLGRQCGVHYIMNCPEAECQRRNRRFGRISRNNGSSNFSLTEAVKAGWKTATSPGGIGWSATLGWVKKSPIGFVGAFTVGYYNNLTSQFKRYYSYGGNSRTNATENQPENIK